MGDTLPDDGNPFSDEPQSIRSYTTTASTQHYACIVNVATAARYHVPSCTPPLHVDNLLISPHTLSLSHYFCILSQTLSVSLSLQPYFLYFISNPIPPKPLFLYFISNPISLSLYRGRKGHGYDAVATLKWLRCLSRTLFSNPLPRSLPHFTLAVKEVATMPLRRCRGCTGSGYDAVALTWLR